MRTMKVVRWVIRIAIAACAVGGFGMSCAFAGGESVPSRVERRVAPDDTVFLPGNTHPMASPELDRGLVEADLALGPLRIVLNRSPEQERGLAAFMERQIPVPPIIIIGCMRMNSAAPTDPTMRTLRRSPPG